MKKKTKQKCENAREVGPKKMVVGLITCHVRGRLILLLFRRKEKKNERETIAQGDCPRAGARIKRGFAPAARHYSFLPIIHFSLLSPVLFFFFFLSLSRLLFPALFSAEREQNGTRHRTRLSARERETRFFFRF